MNPYMFSSYPTQLNCQLIIPIESVGNMSTQPVMILNYNQQFMNQQQFTQTIPATFTCAFASNQETNYSKPANETNYNTTEKNIIEDLTPTTQIGDWLNMLTNGEVLPFYQNQQFSKSTDETLYPLSLHQECDKLYLSYIESCQSKDEDFNKSTIIEEDSLRKMTNDNDSIKSIDNLFCLNLEEFSSCYLSPVCENGSLSVVTKCQPASQISNCEVKVLDVSIGQNERVDGQNGKVCFDSNVKIPILPISPSTVLDSNTTETNHITASPTNNLHTCGTSTAVAKSFSWHVNGKKRQRPLSMQSINSTKKVKGHSNIISNMSNNNINQITWHHVSIDSKMNQQENTFIYENSYNKFETFTSTTPSSSASSNSTVSNNNNNTTTNQPTEFSSIIIETPESISKKMKRGRPKKEFQIE